MHHGIVEDVDNLHLDNKIFGATDNKFRDGAADLIRPSPMSEMTRLNIAKAEKNYKRTHREPLGHSPERSGHLPSKFTEKNQTFGVKTRNAEEPAKNLIFPVDVNYDTEEGNDIYKRSHGSYAPGEQKRRGYNWGVDPDRTVFGRKGDTIAFNGVSKNISEVLKGPSNPADEASIVNLKKVEDFRNMGDMLGRTKNLGQDSGYRPPDLIYGKPSGNKSVSAIDVIRGRYSGADLEPDRDLGKSITPGFRNISTQNRVFGCPSIRSDIPHQPPQRRSLADCQNYGDDVPAQELINPSSFSDLSIGPLAMAELRPKAKILDIFRRIGFKLSPDTAEAIFYTASEGREACSINAFRDVLNRYLLENNLVDERDRR
jgi:hypothetical protein